MHVLQGILSDGRTLLLAVAPAASPGVKSAAAAAMAAGAAAALQASGVAISVHGKEEMLPWKAFHAMAHMVRARPLSCHHLRIKLAPAGSADQGDRMPCEAFCCHLLQQAALEAVCGATPAAQLLAHDALLPAWRAAASTLRLCSEVTQHVAASCRPVHPVHWQHIKLLMQVAGR